MNGPNTRARPTTRRVVSKNWSAFGVLSFTATTVGMSTSRSNRSGAISMFVPCGQL